MDTVGTMDMDRKEELLKQHGEKKVGGPGRTPGYTNEDVVASFGPIALTGKQRAWILEYLKTGNATRAAIQTYDVGSYSAATVIGCRNLKLLREPMRHFLEYKGFGLDDLYRTMKEGLGATKFEKTGPVQYSETPDHSIREKFLRHASRWLGVQAPADVEAEIENAGIVVNVFEPSLQEGLKGRRAITK